MSTCCCCWCLHAHTHRNLVLHKSWAQLLNENTRTWWHGFAGRHRTLLLTACCSRDSLGQVILPLSSYDSSLENVRSFTHCPFSPSGLGFFLLPSPYFTSHLMLHHSLFFCPLWDVNYIMSSIYWLCFNSSSGTLCSSLMSWGSALTGRAAGWDSRRLGFKRGGWRVRRNGQLEESEEKKRREEAKTSMKKEENFLGLFKIHVDG